MRTNKILFFTDLDDTIIQTARKVDKDKGKSVFAYKKDGEAGSYIYNETLLFLEKIKNAGIELIPTTARNLDSYKRTLFCKHFAPKCIILNFGATILLSGTEDKEWKDRISDLYKKIKPIDEIVSDIGKILNKEYNITVKSVDNYYVSIHNKAFSGEEDVLTHIKHKLESYIDIMGGDFYIHENGNSFAILPNFINKGNAVEYIIKKRKPSLTIGAGDNPSDILFLNKMDFTMIPKKSILSQKLFK